MKINLTKKQYWDLIRAVYMADWMANAICDADMKEDDGIKNIRDYIFSFAKEMGYEDYAEYDEKSGNYYATWDMDDEPSVRALIKRYDEHTMWEELAETLGERDFFRTHTKEEIDAMTHEGRVEKVWECEARWGKEFEEHGIDRVGVVGEEAVGNAKKPGV